MCLLSRLLVPCALALLCACSEQGRASLLPSGPPPEGYDFSANLDYAERFAELERIDGHRFEHRAYFEDGWAFPVQPREDGGPLPNFLWTDSTEAELLFFDSMPGAMKLVTEVRANATKENPNGTDILINGELVDRIEVTTDWQRVSVELPRGALVPGLNRVSFKSDRAETLYDALGIELGGGQLFGLSFRPFYLQRVNLQASQVIQWVNTRWPAGSGVRNLPGGATAIEIASTAHVAFHVQVPQDGELRATLAFVDALETTPGPATFRWVLTPRGGEPKVVLEESLDYRGGHREVEASIDEYAGQVVKLEFQVRSSGRLPVLGSWINPVLSGSGEESGDPERIQARDVVDLPPGTPVVAILIDACRADSIGAYGGRPGLTPNIDRLAAEGVLFEQAHSVASYTMASVSSMLVNEYSWRHGTYSENHRLPGTLPTWPEAFQQNGYRTVAIVHSLNGSSRVGFDRGFEEMIEVYKGPRPDARRSVVSAEECLPVLDEVLAAKDDRPLFLWMHLIEPHRPYSPPSPWAGTLSSEYQSDLDGGVGVAKEIKQRRIQPSPEDVAYLRAIYDENLGFVDSVLAEVRSRLEAAGIFDEAVVCLFSDHGEAFLEHPGKLEVGIGHGATTYQEMNHIPLIFRLPARAGINGKVVNSLASGLDILPTLGELVGVPGPIEGPGRSLVGAMGGGSPERQDLISHSYCPREDRFLTMWGYWWKNYKFVYHSGSRPGLYDLAADPGEVESLHATEPILTAYLKQRLQERVGFNVDQGEVGGDGPEEIELDQETIDQLEALGYAR